LNRINALKRASFKHDKIDSFLIFNITNLTYLTGLSGATALQIPSQGESTLYVSSVNYEQTKAEAKDLRVELLKRGDNLMEKMANPSKSKIFAVDTLSIEGWRALAKAVGGEKNLHLSGNIISKMRIIKDEKEIKLIRKASELTSEGMRVAAETIKPGVKEKEVATEVEYTMRKKGSDGVAFDTIIASGKSSAFPHGSCSSRTIKEGDLVMVDIGATYMFYRSDMTRTFTAGVPTEKQRKIYDDVNQAHQKAFENIKPDAKASEVDAAARKVIEQAGFGDFFVHNLGHGVGLEIHEAPTLSADSKDVLEAGMVVTDEPGIYLPGIGGVRIEDTVLVGRGGAEKLTVGPYYLSK
jgi:Xaa-Pro aminopeptidase